jgi:hypothetical protein
MKNFLSWLDDAKHLCEWALLRNWTIEALMDGNVFAGTNPVVTGEPMRIWGRTPEGLLHTPGTLVAAHRGIKVHSCKLIPLVNGIFMHNTGRQLGLWDYQTDCIRETCEGKIQHPCYDANFRAEIIVVLGLQL